MEKTLGQLLSDAMRRRGLTGVQLASRIGRSESFVSELINDEKKVPPPPATLAAIGRELGVSQMVMLMAWGYTVSDEPPALPFDSERAILATMVPDLEEREARIVRKTVQAFIDEHDAQKVAEVDKRVFAGAS